MTGAGLDIMTCAGTTAQPKISSRRRCRMRPYTTTECTANREACQITSQCSVPRQVCCSSAVTARSVMTGGCHLAGHSAAHNCHRAADVAPGTIQIPG